RTENLARPAAARYVEHEGAGSVGNVGGALAREAEANVILGQHDRPDASLVVRLVLTHPKELGEGEVGEGGIARELNDALGADLLTQIRTLLLGANVAPNQSRTHNLAGGIEQGRAVHL